MSSTRIGFIGAGNMAQALAKGFINTGVTKASNILASSPKSDQVLLDQMTEIGCLTTYENKQVATDSDVIIMAVKPNVIPAVLSDISACITPKRPLVTSIALGVSLSFIERNLRPESRVIRIMPNTPALVQSGASVFARGGHASFEDASLIRQLLCSVGTCDEVAEVFLDAITGLSGAGPAFMYVAIEALADGGVKMGLPRNLATKLAAQTMMGAAKMVLETGKHPAILKDEVCSPGGCTIRGLGAMEDGGARAAFIRAVQAATEQSLVVSGKM